MESVSSSHPEGMPANDLEAESGFGYHEHFLARSGRMIQVYKKVMEVDVGCKLDKAKTIGTIIAKNSPEILMVAHSGYTSNAWSHNKCLDTKKWNQLALHHVAREIGFKFPTTQRDTNGAPVSEEFRGRAHAGHVEVLLASWYIVHLLRTELGCNGHEEELVKQLYRLKGLNLGDNGTAFITLDKDPCYTCSSFLRKLMLATHVVFLVPDSLEIGPIKLHNGDRDSENGSSDQMYLNPEPILEPLVPASRLSRRQRTSLMLDQWTPQNPEDLLSTYKKKTPVLHPPGCSRPPSSHSPEADDIHEYWKDSPSFRPRATLGAKTPGAVSDGPSWEDVGDGILMCRGGAQSGSLGPEAVPIKFEERQFSFSPLEPLSPPNIPQPQPQIDFNVGEMFARSAYEETQKILESVEDVEYNEVEMGHPRPSRLNYATTKNHIKRLQSFRHEHINDSDESIFKSRYSILGPKADS
ncbi:hypothetical protein F5B22DRAFT_657574 [Xylaria bambusicola]|uniref:uncharacterized protein n=1 Tax=Xylaria bambusicola TaxID=326684 RepID=UPI0020089DD9|nr:uncharacterized protein F5B22DRAFT_657574 [Xylaria bambusicola]KAI0512714.1 hypothetical protein F5B22DRAFT_657574 [Xylaria bambusicola]